ncbi:hypothetical protein HPB50_013959 [Hyalomma asiaticum]|uniref:Uncharacterized protein n=1 Tax=Hyalomma asiaticum TaxID=266040 RepID=A0ACB7THW6_HYAAI|nr:hypothetical protein HPB50_013959 [Hyalomma asiaticum]
MGTSLLPALKPLDTTQDLWVAWKLWESKYELYATATGLSGKPNEVQAATFLVIIGEEGRRTYRTFKFEDEGDRNDVNRLSKNSEEQCKPVVNLAYHDFGTERSKGGRAF